MDPQQWVGRDIDGRYRVESVLGVGGMGVVLRAKHLFTGVPAAVKILHPQFQLDPEIQARFFAEAQAPNTIGHPAIVKVSDAGRTPDGIVYMVMELLVGRSLREALSRRQLSPDQIKRVISDLLSALGQAHARGFVHRDLKPDNVFLCAPNDEVKLLDFGIAKALGDIQRRTAAGALLGTPAYMAPEQLADASAVDSRADLWAIGVMLYEMITGRLPIAGTTPQELMIAVASGAVIPIQQVMPSAPYPLVQFFERALSRDPRLRFGAAAELSQSFAALTWGPGAVAPQVSGTMATAASTAASVAPSALAYAPPQGAVSTAASIAPAPMPLMSLPPQRSKALLIVAVLAVVAIVVGIAIAMSSGKKAESIAVADAKVVEPIGDPDPPDAAPRRPTCAEQCETLARSCGTQLPSCEDDCKTRGKDFAECMERSERDCDDGAICGFQKICGKPPAGRRTCKQVLDCQIRCGGDLQCGCDCDAELDPKQANTLGRVNACILRATATGCTNPQCVASRCSSQLAACR